MLDGLRARGHQLSSLYSHHQATRPSGGSLVLLPLPPDSEKPLHNHHGPNAVPLDGSFQGLEMKNGLRA